jgi:hypothetical protein
MQKRRIERLCVAWSILLLKGPLEGLGLLPEPKPADEGVGVSAQTGARW